MRRWISFITAFYPRSWREEFGDEFDALLDDVKPRWRVFWNVLRGAIEMQITEGTHWLKLVAATAAVGAIVAWGMSYRVAPRYVSSAVVSVTPQPDPVRPTSSEVLRERANERVAEMASQILSRAELTSIIQDPRLKLYEAELTHTPLEDVIDEMRRNIRIVARPSTDGGLAPIVFNISFTYPDQVKAQAAVDLLSRKFTELSALISKVDGDAYRGFWGDMAAQEHTKPAPPPPVEALAAVLDSASLPTEASGPSRFVYLARGVGAGLLLGLLAAVAMRSPRGVRQLVGFAVAGCVVACAASFLIPSRFTSTAVMRISGAQITEDPLAPLPGAPPVAEFLGQIEPELLSFQRLSRIIQDPRLNLYARERATRSMEDVVRNMLKNDLRITAITAAPLGVKDAVSAFSISFSYPDRYKAQQTVQSLMNTFDEIYQHKQMTDAAQMSVTMHSITQRKAGEILEVLDTASLPVSPETPRLAITLTGLGIGLLLGLITLFRRYPRAPAPQVPAA